MKREFERSMLGDVLTLQRGHDITKAEQREGPYPVISSSGPGSTHDTYKCEGPGVVIGRKGSLGGVYWSDGPYWPHDTTLWVRDFKGNDPKFCYYLLQTMELARLDVGASNPTLNRNHLHRLPVRVPPIEEQRSIARVLSTFDELLENTRRRIEILEETARLTYRKWFVHFRFPGHEDVELVDSALGPIPEGWDVVSVNTLADLVRGRSYRRSELVDEPEGRPFLNLKCIDRGGGFRKSGLKRYAGRFKPEQLAQPGDTVIAVTDMTQERKIVAQAGRVPALPEGPGVISLDLVRVVPRDRVDADFLYGMFRYSTFSGEVKEHANGTNVLHLSPDRIREYRIALPPAELQQAFRDAVRPMYDLIENLGLQSDVLAETRDLLLPRLVSGELDVPVLDPYLDSVA